MNRRDFIKKGTMAAVALGVPSGILSKEKGPDKKIEVERLNFEDGKSNFSLGKKKEGMFFSSEHKTMFHVKKNEGGIDISSSKLAEECKDHKKLAKLVTEASNKRTVNIPSIDFKDKSPIINFEHIDPTLLALEEDQLDRWKVSASKIVKSGNIDFKFQISYDGPVTEFNQSIL